MTGAGTICGGWPGWAWYGCMPAGSGTAATMGGIARISIDG